MSEFSVSIDQRMANNKKIQNQKNDEFPPKRTRAETSPTSPDKLDPIKNLNRTRPHRTQALQAIKKYEQRSTRLTQRNRQMWSNPYTIFKQIDDQYTRVHFHKELYVDKIMRVQVFPHTDQYFVINTDTLIFPVRVFLRNVMNQGVLYVGFDREFPGVERLDQKKGEEQEKNLYDFKFNFDKDIMCVLKNQKKRTINKIYLTLVAKKELLMVGIKYDYIGYESYAPQETQKVKRSITEGNLSFKNASADKKWFQLPPASPLKSFISTLRQNQLLLQKHPSIQQQLIKRTKTQLTQSQLLQLLHPDPSMSSPKKNFLQINQTRLSSLTRSNSSSNAQQKKQKLLHTTERIKANRQQLEQYREKERLVKEGALKLKKAIQQYQRLFREERLRDRKILHLVAPVVFVARFVLKSNLHYNKQTESITKIFMLRCLVKKFTNAMRKRYIDNIILVGNFKARNMMSCYHLFQLAAKMVQPKQKQKCGQLIFSAFTSLQGALILNHSLNQASNYRTRCRTIQRRWIIKYRARVEMLQIFAIRHVESMLKEFPQLRLGNPAFKSGNYCHRVCVEYMIDETAKFRQIYDAYRKRVQEIDDFVIENQKIGEFNKGKIESKCKKYLEIPKKPTPPQHRFFRNLDILKSMLRAWFQIEYKKILKRNAK